MNDYSSYSISYENMKKIIKNYFMQQGRNVEVRISNEVDEDRLPGTVITSIWYLERRTIAGVESKAHICLPMEDLKEILSSVLEQENKELIDLQNNATIETSYEGQGMAEHRVQKISDKTFTIISREKQEGIKRTFEQK